ncbi:MAG: FAD-binding protein, partial [Deltaproteobacteria bacterium]|nr:FAD-binding protein [Deltaproteobacteria bacterium]
MIDMETAIETDVLIVGGGIGGLMAGINAARQGVDVMIAEKANTKRSGSGATGNDHFLCYIPELHGDLDPYVEECFETLVGKFQDRNLMERHLIESFNRVKDWDSWGISMRPTGDWEFVGHALPGRVRTHLKYAGDNQKSVLTKQARKAGVRIVNKMPVTDVIVRDGETIGALGINIRDKKPVIQVFKAKSVILATGSANRIYATQSPGWMFNTAFCPSSTGTGRAVAYRVGARLLNMELPYTHAGPKYFSRCGKATWIGVLRDPGGTPVCPFVSKPEKLYGDPAADIWNTVFSDMYKSGKGPVYMDCHGISREDYEYMMWALHHEGNTAMINYMESRGIDPRKHMVEFNRYEPILAGRGIQIDENAETSIPGLYAVGDEIGNFCAFIAGAVTFGWIAGKNAADRANGITSFKDTEKNPLVEQRRQSCSEIMDRENGPGWKEANLAVQQIMNDYAGKEVRSHSLLNAGLKYLRDLKAEVLSNMTATDAHTLMRCLEVIDLIDIGEIVFLTALERKETRGMHVRTDYPFTNPLLNNKFLTVRQENGEVRLEWR